MMASIFFIQEILAVRDTIAGLVPDRNGNDIKVLQRAVDRLLAAECTKIRQMLNR
jgi:hypothetical protein